MRNPTTAEFGLEHQKVFFPIKLAASAAGLNSEPQNIE
jgi:hypothetical protein